MKNLLLTAISVAMLSLSGGATAQTTSENTVNISNKDKAIAVLNSIQTGDQTAIAYVNPEKYIQHNLSVADGLAGLGEALQALPKGSAKVDVIRAFEDGDYVFTHTDYNFFGPKIGFDVLRFEDGLIVEHWDNLDVTATEPNPSGRTQIDGPTQAQDIDKTEQNKQVVSNFIDAILVNGKIDTWDQFVDGDNYIQHNTAVADGLTGLTAALTYFAEQNIHMVYTDVHKILGEGNFVLAISEGTFADKPTSFYDLFRVENGKIAEHWDVIETILPKDQWKNNNGKFGGL